MSPVFFRIAFAGVNEPFFDTSDRFRDLTGVSAFCFSDVLFCCSSNEQGGNGLDCCGMNDHGVDSCDPGMHASTFLVGKAFTMYTNG